MDKGLTKYDDRFFSGRLPDTEGTMTFKGTAEFYEALALPADFKATGKAPTGDLPTTRKKPENLMGGTGSISHNITSKWVCCPAGTENESELSGVAVLPSSPPSQTCACRV
jgi:hypothetical protein